MSETSKPASHATPDDHLHSNDPRVLLAHAPMRVRQIIVIAMCVLLNALDGFDVLSISFASPGIAAEWGIDRAALGIVLSMELIGMAVGSILLGNVADRWGRRPTMLLCLVVMGVGMGLAVTASGVTILTVYRLITGLGIGGMLACTNAVVAEFASAKHKTMAVAIMAIGYPFGAVVGGSISTMLLASTGNWRSVFIFGAIITLVMIPLVWLLVPESVGYLLQRRPRGALERINHTLTKIGHRTMPGLPPETSDEPRASLKQLFSGPLGRVTLVLTLAYFLHIMTFYFILKWVPKIVVDMGYEPAAAGGVLVWANVGGMLGGILLSFLSVKMGTRALCIAGMVLSTAMVAYFGHGSDDIAGLSLIAAAAGFFTNAVVCGLYALIAHSFPSAVRAGGTGFVIGVGRGGAAVGPILAGFLFAGGMGLQGVAIVMALGSLLAAGILLLLRPMKETAL